MRARTTVGLGWAIVLAACLVKPWSVFSAKPHEGVSHYTTNARDRLACERQLNIIFGALSRYREEHDGECPEKLQALVPNYIHDGKMLICPYAQKRGGLKEWKRTAVEISSDSYTSYSFEFGLRPYEDFYWRGVPRKTWRDVKLRLVQRLGPIVPVVRCQDHRPYLNLAVNGEIYESDLDWEDKFHVGERFRIVQQLFALPAPTPLSAAQFPPRDPRLDATALDLTPYYNGLLTNSWQGFPGNDLSSLPAGLNVFDGVRFDVRGVIQLRALEIPVEFPLRVDGVKVGQKCARLHFIHAVSTFATQGFTNGFYVIHYADGEKRDIRLIYGRDIADWWPDPYGVVPTHATIAWSGQNQATPAYGKSIQLFHTTWVNELPNIEIATISFDSRGKIYPSGPFVVAISLDRE